MIDDLEMNRNKNYVIPASTSFFDELDTLTIELASTFGDADLKVTVDDQVHGSYSQLKFDQVKLSFGENGVNFGSDVLISVRAKVMTHY